MSNIFYESSHLIYPFTIVSKGDRVMAFHINEAIEALTLIYERGRGGGGDVSKVFVATENAARTDITTFDYVTTGELPSIPDYVNEGDIIYAELFNQLRDCLNAIGTHRIGPA